MAPRLRRMKPYYPRKKRKQHSEKGLSLHKQSLYDLHHKLGAPLSRYLILLEEGKTPLIEEAKQKAKGCYLKYAEEMKKIAQIIGTPCFIAVKDYLETVDLILRAHQIEIDQGKVRQCYEMTRKLEKILEAAA